MTVPTVAAGAGGQLTAVLRGAIRLVDRATGVPSTATVAATVAVVGPTDVLAATAAQARALLPAADREAYDDRVAAARRVGADATVTVLERALATTWSVAAVAEVADAVDDLPPGDRSGVVDPVRVLARAGRQTDPTTCGSAVLAMLAASGDPALALWLGTGRVLRGALPPELDQAPVERLAALAAGPPGPRFASLQRVLKRRSNARGLLGLPWPARFGTPPWGAARVARLGGLTFGHVPLADTDPEHLGRVLDQVGAALDRGVPVPLYAGGDTTGGLSAALPRHVVLAVARTEDTFTVWEPSAGRLLAVTRAELLAGGRPLPALGRWTHLTWAVLPEL